MELATYFGELIAGVVYLVVAVRLYSLSRRSGESSDRLMAMSFFWWSLSYLSYDVPFALVGGDETRIPAFFEFVWRPLTYLGTLSLALFTRNLFRSRARWAGWFVAGTAVCMVVGLVGSCWVGDWGGIYPISNPWYWLERVGGTAPFVWIGVEGLIQYRKAVLRRELGLCSPLLCNRYLLWGSVGSLWAFVELVVVPQDYIYEWTGQWSAALGLFIGWLEIVPAFMIWCVFFPPEFYRNWVDRLATPAETVDEACEHGS